MSTKRCAGAHDCMPNGQGLNVVHSGSAAPRTNKAPCPWGGWWIGDMGKWLNAAARASIEVGLVEVAPGPVRPGLDGLDERVAGGLVVRARMPVLRAVAAADMPAGHADAQLHPGVAAGDTVLAHALGITHFKCRIRMRAVLGRALRRGQIHLRHGNSLTWDASAPAYAG